MALRSEALGDLPEPLRLLNPAHAGKLLPFVDEIAEELRGYFHQFSELVQSGH